MNFLSLHTDFHIKLDKTVKVATRKQVSKIKILKRTQISSSDNKNLSFLKHNIIGVC